MRDLNKIFERRLQGSCSGLWENREALEKYLKRLRELMEEDEKSKENGTFSETIYHEEINSRPK